MTAEINRMLKTIESLTDGKPWYGDNLTEKLEGIDAKIAIKTPEKLNHNIAEIVCHMQAWQRYVIEQLNGNTAYEVWETDRNWQKIPLLTETQWTSLIAEYKTAQLLLLKTLAEKAESQLDNKVGNRPYNFRAMINGIIQHDVYHIGQISIVRKLVL